VENLGGTDARHLLKFACGRRFLLFRLRRAGQDARLADETVKVKGLAHSSRSRILRHNRLPNRLCQPVCLR